MSTFFICLHSFTKDIQQSRRELYLKEVGWCWGVSERRFVYRAYSNLFALGTRQPWGNLYDEESNKYLSELRGQIGAQLQLVGGGGEQGEGEGDLTMSVAFQKIISPSSATFPGRRGSNQAFSLPLSSSVVL